MKGHIFWSVWLEFRGLFAVPKSFGHFFVDYLFLSAMWSVISRIEIFPPNFSPFLWLNFRAFIYLSSCNIDFYSFFWWIFCVKSFVSKWYLIFQWRKRSSQFKLYLIGYIRNKIGKEPRGKRLLFAERFSDLFTTSHSGLFTPFLLSVVLSVSS